MKSTIVIYDYLCELDRTEVTYANEKELKAAIHSIMPKLSRYIPNRQAISSSPRR